MWSPAARGGAEKPECQMRDKQETSQNTGNDIIETATEKYGLIKFLILLNAKIKIDDRQCAGGKLIHNFENIPPSDD